MIQIAAGYERAIQILELEQRRRQLERLDLRLKILSDAPDRLTSDDMDAFIDAPKSTIEPWLKRRPQIAERFRDYLQDPAQISSTFFRFMRLAWDHAGIVDPFAWNWHHLILCQSFEDVANGKILRLLINVPPGLTKSLIAGVFFPAWRWTIAPGESFLYASYSDEIPSRTCRELRTLLLSSWYQKRWGKHFRLTKATEKDLHNSAGGFRLGRGVGGGATGEHPLYVFGDDLQKGIQIASETQMKIAPRFYAGTLATRGVLKNARHVIIQQRLAINDLSGIILGECSTTADTEGVRFATDWHHVCLPMRFRPDSPYRYPLDPRTQEGELIWPEKLNEEAIARLIRSMEMDGQPNVDAQLDQHPRFSSVNTFEDVTKGRIALQDVPADIQQGRAVRAWDRAGTAGGGDWTVGILIVELRGRYFVLDVFRAQLGLIARDNLILKYARHDQNNFPNYRVVNEQMPGPDGRQVHAELSRRLDEIGVQCMAQTPTTDKPTRARPVAAAMKNGICHYLSDKSWTYQFEMELSMFPNGAHDDQVDGLAHGYNALREWAQGKV